MYKIETRSRPRSKLVRDADSALHCVRVYKHSPEDLILQIWDGKRYMLVALFPEEAREIAGALRTIAYQVEHPETRITESTHA